LSPAVAGSAFQDVAGSIMSPACPGRLLIDCPSEEGEQLRELVRQKLAKGESKEEIIAYFVEIYGPSVLPAPPKRGFFLTAWYLPYAAMVFGGAILFLLIKVWARARPKPLEAREPGETRPDSAYEERLERELKELDY
ncbi:MAG: cytochrome c-type biogenesis protein CcmH, partial [Nitrospinota bacterium]